jgi:hypothetical protein
MPRLLLLGSSAITEVPSPILAAGPAAPKGGVNVYLSREPALIEPLLKAFIEHTSITTNLVTVRDHTGRGPGT